MSVQKIHIIDVTLDSNAEVASAVHDFNGVTPLKVSLYVRIVETQDNGSPTTKLTVELSPDDGQTFISYDKLITDAGVDGPVADIDYTATVDDIVSLSMEDAVDYIKVTVTGSADMDAGDFHVVDVWLVVIY